MFLKSVILAAVSLYSASSFAEARINYDCFNRHGGVEQGRLLVWGAGGTVKFLETNPGTSTDELDRTVLPDHSPKVTQGPDLLVIETKDRIILANLASKVAQVLNKKTRESTGYLECDSNF